MKTYTCYCCNNKFQPGEGIPISRDERVLNPYWCEPCINRVCFNLLPAGQTEKEIDRVCTKCGECKPIDQFTLQKKENRRNTVCKSCKAKHSKEYYAANKKLVSEKAAQRYQNKKLQEEQTKQTNTRSAYTSSRYGNNTYTNTESDTCSNKGCNNPVMFRGSGTCRTCSGL
jgi:hypothetical protein